MQNNESEFRLKTNYKVIVIKINPVFIDISYIMEVHFRCIEKMRDKKKIGQAKVILWKR